MYNIQRVSLGDDSMKINLYDIMAVVGKSIKTETTLDLITGYLQGERILVEGKEPVRIDITHTHKDMVSVNVDTKVTVERACSRCLEAVKEDYELHIFREVDISQKKAIDSEYDESIADTDEISYIEDCNLDVDMLILDELYTILSMGVLCKEDCKGICKVCGTNLNKSTCDCDQTVPDPRMAVFSDIFNQFKEV